MLHLDVLHIKLRWDGKIDRVAIYNVLGIGLEDVFLAAIDGLTGFKDAIPSVFPKTRVQHCTIH